VAVFINSISGTLGAQNSAMDFTSNTPQQPTFRMYFLAKCASLVTEIIRPIYLAASTSVYFRMVICYYTTAMCIVWSLTNFPATRV